MQKWFGEAASTVSRWTGSSWAFMFAFGVIVVWAISGPIFGFSDTWQLVINTGTTIVTFLMVFLIQNTQNRDQRALQLKLDELLRAQPHVAAPGCGRHTRRTARILLQRLTQYRVR